MRPIIRLFIASTLALSAGVAVVLAATQNRLPKYAADGSLVDSAVYESGGNIGIGTTTPTVGRLQVEKTTAGQVIYATSNVTSGENYGIDAEAFGIGAGLNVGGFFYADRGTVNRAIMIPSVLGASAGNYAIYSESPAQSYFAGNIGIGTASPAAKLHVAGNVTVDGNIAAKYQDVAEWVPSHGRIVPGTVVVIRRGDTNVVEASARGYDTRVAGVVSPRPGLVLGEPGTDRVLVAHSGRVRIKVDASYGAVEAGDLLVTSPTPGYAMRSEPLDLGGEQFHRPGTVLGKALEALASGRNEILVLLTLQ